MKKNLFKFVLPLFVIGCFSFASSDSNGPSYNPLNSGIDKITTVLKAQKPQTVTIRVIYHGSETLTFCSKDCDFAVALQGAIDQADAARPFTPYVLVSVKITYHTGYCL